jgi:hypothetical protein
MLRELAQHCGHADILREQIVNHERVAGRTLEAAGDYRGDRTGPAADAGA